MRRWIQNRAEAMTEEGLAYLLSIVIFGLSVLLYSFSKYWDIQLSQIFAYAAMAFLLYGFWSYLAPILRSASESILIKGIWVALTFAGATIAVSLAQVLVNEAVQVPSSAFPHTQALVAVLVAPVVIGVFVIALGLLLVPVFQIMLYSESGELSIKAFLSPKKASSKRTGAEAKYIGRLFAFFVAIGLCFGGLARADAYLNGVSDFVRWFAYHFEAERFSTCSVGPEAKVSYLNGDQVVMVDKSEEGYIFQVVECADDR